MDNLFTPERIWSEQQNAVFAFFVDGTGNLIVRARAGTGKTTTIVEAVKRWMAVNPGKTAVVCAFNTRIAKELTRKLDGAMGVEVKTLHAIGYAACRRFRDGLKLEDTKKVFQQGGTLRKDAIARTVCGAAAPDAIVRMVAKLHTLGRETAPHATKLGDLTALAIQHECQPDGMWEKSGFGLAYVEAKALDAMVMAAEVKSGDVIDFSDMIFLPCRHGWLAGQWDLCVVDEAQDMTTAQLEIARGSVNENGRMVIVGDNRQAIYGFRGADVDSLDRLKLELHATERPLNVSYRISQAVKRAAQRYVSDIEAADTNPEGSEYDTTQEEMMKEAAGGNFILSRVNAPLVPIAMSLLRNGKRAKVAGKDIGRDVLAMMRKMKARTVPELLRAIETHVNREVARQEKMLAVAVNGRKKAIEAKIELIKDQADMLVSFTDGAKNLDEIQARVEFLFAEEGESDEGVIVCSSIHKAKGLEARRVYVLADTLRTTTEEELNLCYVAITRAQLDLAWVGQMRVGA